MGQPQSSYLLQWCAFLDEVQESVIGDDDHRVDMLPQTLDCLLCLSMRRISWIKVQVATHFHLGNILFLPEQLAPCSGKK